MTAIMSAPKIVRPLKVRSASLEIHFRRFDTSCQTKSEEIAANLKNGRDLTESVMMSQTLCVEESPVARLREAWGLVGLESGELLRNGVTEGPIVIWPSRIEAEDVAEKLGRRYVAVRVSTD